MTRDVKNRKKYRRKEGVSPACSYKSLYTIRFLFIGKHPETFGCFFRNVDWQSLLQHISLLILPFTSLVLRSGRDKINAARMP